MFTCCLCSESFADETLFHKHIRYTHKTKLENYYSTFHERYDLYSGELILWKGDRELYLSAVFNTRSNLIKYCKKFPEKARGAIVQCIKSRSETKGLGTMLSTVASRTVVYPTPLLVESLGLDWCEIGQELGLKCIFDYKQQLEFESDNGLSIVVDTREQNQLNLDKKYKIVKNALNFGDYTSNNNFKNIFIERKSLGDAAGTLSAGYERFQREIERAIEFGAYIVVLVERDLNDLIGINYQPDCKKIRATGEFLTHRMRELLGQYNNLQFLFVKGRVEAARVLPKILTLKNDVKNTELSYFYDKKQL